MVRSGLLDSVYQRHKADSLDQMTQQSFVKDLEVMGHGRQSQILCPCLASHIDQLLSPSKQYS